MLFERTRPAQRLRLVVGVAVVAGSLACAGLALAAPRPSGTAAVPAAPAATESVVTSTGGVYTRADMPRPSGTVTALGLEDAQGEVPAPSTPSKLPEKQVGAAVATGQDETAADDGWSPDMDCMSCHALEDIQAATADSTVLTDTNGTVVNPHDLPAIDDHAGITCASCHKSHEVSESTEKSAKRTCASCHHADVYECYTCHA